MDVQYVECRRGGNRLREIQLAIDGATPILLVEGRELMVRVTLGLLSELGFYVVDAAWDADTAMAMACAKAYALVIADREIGPLNFVGARSIVVTTRFKLDAGLSGATRLLKPFNAHSLKAAIEEAFAA